MSTPTIDVSRRVASTGIPGLDDIMAGGFTRKRLFLVEGMPGSGKTTLALQYLMEGARRGESVLYVTLSETKEEMLAIAESMGGRSTASRSASSRRLKSALDLDEQHTMFHPSEIELASTTKRILDDVERLKPTRVVFDSLSELRLLAGTALRYRRQILALKQFFATRDCTVVLLDDLTATDHDLQMQSIAHGVVLLEQLNPEYGSERRRLRVVKYRGVQFRGGYHDYVITQGRPRRLPTARRRRAPPGDVTGETRERIPELDTLLGGGIEEGTSTLIVGAAGTGKSTLAAQFAAAAAAAGSLRRSSCSMRVLKRCSCDAAGSRWTLSVHDRDGHRLPASGRSRRADAPESSYTPFEKRLKTRGAKIVVIDSLNGYLNAMPEERFLTIQLHELLMYLGTARRRHDLDRRSPGADRQPDESPLWTQATWRTPWFFCAISSSKARCGRQSR